jgi:hypothetical protein
VVVVTGDWVDRGRGGSGTERGGGASTMRAGGGGGSWCSCESHWGVTPGFGVVGGGGGARANMTTKSLWWWWCAGGYGCVGRPCSTNSRTATTMSSSLAHAASVTRGGFLPALVVLSGLLGERRRRVWRPCLPWDLLERWGDWRRRGWGWGARVTTLLLSSSVLRQDLACGYRCVHGRLTTLLSLPWLTSPWGCRGSLGALGGEWLEAQGGSRPRCTSN